MTNSIIGRPTLTSTVRMANNAFEQLRTHPSAWVVPLFSRKANSVDQLEGSAWFVATADKPQAVTAAHVMRQIDKDRHVLLAVPTGRSAGLGRGEMTSIPVTAWFCHDTLDVAWLKAPLPSSVQSLAIMDCELMFEWDVMCYDYSPGHPIRQSDGSLSFFADAWAHKGNVVRGYREHDVHLMNTSFPLMQGASGSPIMIKVENEWYAAGMAIANLEQEFAPSILAQTVSVTERDGTSETIKYFLPYGIALSSEELIRGIRKFFEPELFTPTVEVLAHL